MGRNSCHHDWSRNWSCTLQRIYPGASLAKEPGKTSWTNTLVFRLQEQKRYVTHCLRESGEQVWELLEQGGHLYVCGDAKMMAKDVRNIIVEICKSNGSLSDQDAENYVKKLESQKRYSADVWS